VAGITHNRKREHLGRFDDEREAGRAVDTAARRLRGEDAHGGRPANGGNVRRLNFPTEGEVKRAQEKGMLTEEGRTVAVRRKKVAAAAASQQQGPSEFVGVSWDKHGGSWRAQISTNGKRQYLDLFDDEEEAARAVDTAARRLRGDDAHGGRSGNNNWNRLNFPSMGEAWRAQQLGMPAARSSVSL